MIGFLRRMALALMFSGAVMAAVFTIVGYLGFLWESLDLLSHFRVQYLLWISASMALSLLPGTGDEAHKRWIFRANHMWCPVLAPFFLLNSIEAAQLFLPDTSGPELSQNQAKLRVMQINLWAHRERIPKILDSIRQADPDVISLQELTPEAEKILLTELKEFGHRFTFPQSDCFGVGFMSKIPLKDGKIRFCPDENGVVVSPPVATLVLNSSSGDVCLASMHLLPPTSEHANKVNRVMRAELASFCRDKRQMILLGDLNMTRFSMNFAPFLKESGLKNSEPGFGWQPSWPTFIPPLMIAIDHCLVSPKVKVSSRFTGAPSGSDHLPLVVELEF